MTIRIRALFFIVLGILLIWFIYIEREILTPFILAAIFAYIFNPVIDFFYHRIRLPRTITILILYILMMGITIVFSIFLTRRIFIESLDLNNYVDNFVVSTKKQIGTLPELIQPAVADLLTSIQKTKIFSTESLFALFPKAISRIVSLFIFLFSAFYFLKEGRAIVKRVLGFIPESNRGETELILKKINLVFSGYLRGQLILVFLVSLMLFIVLSIIGVRFALILAIFSGFAEIVPFIGPITAGTVAALVVLLTGQANFGLNPMQAAIVVALAYFFIRHFQDYFITPYVMGRMVKLHPLLVLFSVLAGGHVAGILGFILAVPIAASLKIILEFFIEKINKMDKKVSGR